MFQMLRIEVSEYIVSYSEPLNFYYIDINKLTYDEIYVNPFCIMSVNAIKDKMLINNIFGNDINYCIITFADGNEYIIHKSVEETNKMIGSTIDTIGLPF
jgi:uncharacterized protein YlzI (FlbEa/FlbD family)